MRRLAELLFVVGLIAVVRPVPGQQRPSALPCAADVRPRVGSWFTEPEGPWRLNQPFIAFFTCCNVEDGDAPYEWGDARRLSRARASGISLEAIDEMTEYGVNLTDVRLGPYWDPAAPYPQPFFADENGRPDLSRPNYALEEYHLRRARHARARGMYLVEDVTDPWLMKGNTDDDRSPRWWSAFYQAGVPWDCSIKQGPPPDYLRAWIRRWATAFRDEPNVLWLVGNESFACGGTSVEYEVGVAREILSVIPDAVVGTNAQDEQIERLPMFGFAAYHWITIPDRLPDINKPLYVNEHDGSHPSPERWALESEAGLRRNVLFGFWRQDASRAEWLAALGKARELRARLVPQSCAAEGG